MGYRSFREDRIFAVRWVGSPTAEVVSRMTKDVGAARAAAGAPLYGVWLISAEDPIAPTDIRDAIVRRWPEIMTSCATLHIVLVGPSVKASLFRSVLRTMIVVARVKNVTIVESIDEVLHPLREVMPSQTAFHQLKRRLTTELGDGSMPPDVAAS